MNFFRFILLAILTASQAHGSAYSMQDWEKAIETGSRERLLSLYQSASKAGYTDASIKFVERFLYGEKPTGSKIQLLSQAPEFRRDALSYYSMVIYNQRKVLHGEQARAEVKRFISSGEGGRIAEMLVALSGFRQKGDLPLLIEFSKSIDPNVYRSAVISIRKLCFPEGKKFLEEELLNVADSGKKGFIEQTKGLSIVCQ
jgi:hypothetical protein